MASEKMGRFLVVFALLSMAMPGCGWNDTKATQKKRIGVVYTAPHQIIDEIIEGFERGLEGSDVEILKVHANGDWSQFGATVDGALAKNLDVLVPITTPISQSALERAPKGVEICFLGVTDPIGAGLVDSINSPKKCTGVSDLAPFAAVLGLIEEVYAGAETVGVPFNPEDQPAVFGVRQIEKFAGQYGLRVDARPVTSADELYGIVVDLAGSTDCILIGSDNLMFESAPTIIKAARAAGKPVFAGDSTSIKAGAVGGYTIDYSKVGREGAVLVSRILAGENAGEIPCVVLKDGVLEWNGASADELGLVRPQQNEEVLEPAVN